MRSALVGKRAAVFDFYNTLALDGELPPPVWHHLNDLGYRCTPELQTIFEPDAFDGCLTPRDHAEREHEAWMRSNWRRLLQLSGVEFARLDAVLDCVLERQAGFTIRPAPHGADLVRFFRAAGYATALCSNWESDVVPQLRAVDLAPDLFDVIAVSAEVGARKPHPAIFEYVCDALDIRPDQAIHIGDSWRCDVAGALRAGLQPIWLRWAAGENMLPDLVADAATMSDLYAQVRAATDFRGSSHEC